MMPETLFEFHDRATGERWTAAPSKEETAAILRERPAVAILPARESKPRSWPMRDCPVCRRPVEVRGGVIQYHEARAGSSTDCPASGEVNR